MKSETNEYHARCKHTSAGSQHLTVHLCVLSYWGLPTHIQPGWFESCQFLNRDKRGNELHLAALAHFEGSLLRIPTSIRHGEMLFDRLRISDLGTLGYIWSQVMQRV